ncbi:unnamed protein product [Schistosoma curassoni]|uniref:Transposase n=1 Tax=Schistosoma curassoni TaxID=6186 RepID=A0A183KFI4_9TREM|nr:unnamed protein product [Schistosoma curassoni]
MEPMKAVGPENISAEAPKSDTKATTNMLHVLVTEIWKEAQVPTDWKQGYLTKERRSEQMCKPQWHHITVSTRERFQQSVIEQDERFSRHPTS